jgi:hypothetical protein
MNAVVLHVNTSSRISTSPTMRIARFAAETLDLPLIHDLESAQKVLRLDTLDVLLIKHGMLKFSEQRAEVIELYRRAGCIINLENDYTFEPDRRLTKINPTRRCWSTCAASVEQHGGSYVNWNVLTMLPPEQWAQPMPFVDPTMMRLLYYGAFRPGRINSFETYFRHTKVPLTVSSWRGGPAFQALNPAIETVAAFRSPLSIRRYPMSLYIEDVHSHEHFTSPANRFYECLQQGVAMLFDVATAKNLLTAGFDVSDFTVSNADEVAEWFPHWDSIRKEQRRMWWQDYTVGLRRQVTDAMAKLQLQMEGVRL